MLPTYPRGVNRVCPLLGLSGDCRSAIDAFDAAHRCHSDSAPVPIERQWQAKFCLTASHPSCERYQQAVARRGIAVLGRAPIGDGLASTRMVLAPEPAWRGIAGRAQSAGRGRLVAFGAVATVIGAGAFAVATATNDDRPNGAATGSSPSPPASASPRPTATPTMSSAPTVAPTATLAPTPPPETPAPTATPAPPAQRTYVVQEGDSLAVIAQQFGTTVEAIQAANGIADPNVLTIGDVLVIP